MSRLPVSVVIPVYNHEQFVRKAIESVLNQSRRPMEIIVVDDGSTDSSAAAVENLSSEYPEIIFWSQSNQGAHQAINAGIYRSTMKYVAVLNSDDIYHHDRLQVCMDMLESDADLDAVSTGIDFIDEKDRPVKNPWFEQALDFYRKSSDMGLSLMNGNFIMTTSNLFCRRSVFFENRGFASLRYAHDLDFLLDLLSRGRRIGLIRKNLLTYRMHKTNTISEDHRKVRIEWAYCCAKYLWKQGFQGFDSDRQCKRIETFIDVFEKHSLTRLVVLFLSFFKNNDHQAVSFESAVREEPFYRLLYRNAG